MDIADPVLMLWPYMRFVLHTESHPPQNVPGSVLPVLPVTPGNRQN